MPSDPPAPPVSATSRPPSASPAPGTPRSPWASVPTLYFAQGLPYVAVNLLSVTLYKNLGVSNADIAALEKELSDQLGLRVELRHQEDGRGELRVVYTNLEQLDQG